MKLQVLVDNNTIIDQYYLGEPGVSFYIEADDKRILFDAGYSDIFIENGTAMGVDFNQLTHIVISHGHNDHTRGLQYLPDLIDTSRVQLIAHPGCFVPKWYGKEYIGAPFTDEVAALFDYRPQRGSFQLSEHCFFLGEIPVRFDFEQRRAIGSTGAADHLIPDLLLDDTAMVCKTDQGLFIITGCSHSGICNIIQYAKEVCQDTRIAGIIGGFHLSEANERLDQTISYLEKTAADRLCPCHCVSLAAKHEIMKRLDITEIGVGMELSV